ncbi:MAG: sulfite exporter TauE/SafE family protein, partial [Chloroflexi bacterium]|nr:sulfite exporter TauE/SafE family protein [Chloroflexota bacterium]
MQRSRAMLTGVVGGFTSGMTGVGGGVTMIPLLTVLLGLTQRRAQATSLAIVIALATVAVVPYVVRGEVKWALAAALAAGGA